MGNEQDAFLIGWLDAIWSSFVFDNNEVKVPADIQRKLIRKGFLAPKSPSCGGTRRFTITPIGMQMVRSMNDKFNIKRTG